MPLDSGSPRGIDHLVLAVRDLDAAEAAFKAMGFTLTPRAYHPFGTANQLAMFDGNFVELLGVADASKIPEHSSDGFSFAAWNRDFIEMREGVSMLVLDSTDPAADHDAFKAAGLTTWPPTSFARAAVQPDGSEAEVSFTLCFAVSAAVPSLPSFTCRQHAPQNFWKPAFQAHANTASVIDGLTVATDDVGTVAAYYTALLGADAVVPDEEGEGAVARTARGSIEILPRARLAERFGDAAPAEPAVSVSPGPAFAGWRVSVADLEAARAALGAGGVSYSESGGVLRVPAKAGFGAVIEFSCKGET